MGGGPTGGVKSGGGLDEVGARSLGGTTGGDDLLIGEGCGLDDDLEDRIPTGLAHAANIGFDSIDVALLDQAEVDDHVDLLSTLGDGVGGLGCFDSGGMGAGGESADRGQVQAIGQFQRQQARGDAHAVGTQGRSLGDERINLGGGGLGIEEGVVDEGGDLGARGHEGSFRERSPHHGPTCLIQAITTTGHTISTGITDEKGR